MPPDCYAAVKLFQAEAYGLAGASHHCIVAYQIAYHKLPRSVSFAPTARIRAADLYERSARSHYAITIYQACLSNTARTSWIPSSCACGSRPCAGCARIPTASGARLVSDVARRVARRSSARRTQDQPGAACRADVRHGDRAGEGRKLCSVRTRCAWPVSHRRGQAAEGREHREVPLDERRGHCRHG